MKKRKPKNPKPAPAAPNLDQVADNSKFLNYYRVKQSLIAQIENGATPELIGCLLRLDEAEGKEGDFEALRGELRELRDRVALLESTAGVRRAPAASTPGGLRLG